MSSILAPYGLKPIYHPSGIVRPKALDVASGYATNLFMYTPVALGAPAAGLIIYSAVAGPIIGCFLGCEFTPANGRRQFSPWWTGGQVATQIVCYYTDDELIQYEIQADGPVAETQIGNQASINAETGNQTTGFSTVSLATGTLTTSGNLMLRVSGNVISYPIAGSQNAWGDAYTIVQVMIANHQFRATRAAF